jgi:hypothetical protein
MTYTKLRRVGFKRTSFAKKPPNAAVLQKMPQHFRLKKAALRCSGRYLRCPHRRPCGKMMACSSMSYGREPVIRIICPAHIHDLTLAGIVRCISIPERAEEFFWRNAREVAQICPGAIQSAAVKRLCTEVRKSMRVNGAANNKTVGETNGFRMVN